MAQCRRRDEAFEATAILVVAWRVLATVLLGTVCGLLSWSWSLAHSPPAVLGLAVTVLLELAASVPFYRQNFAKIFED